MNKFSCPYCGKHLAFRLEQFGKWMNCPKCSRSIQIGHGKPREKGRRSRGGAALMSPDRVRVAMLSLLLFVVVAIICWSFI